MSKDIKKQIFGFKNLASQKLRVQKNVGKNDILYKIFGPKYESLKKGN